MLGLIFPVRSPSTLGSITGAGFLIIKLRLLHISFLRLMILFLLTISSLMFLLHFRIVNLFTLMLLLIPALLRLVFRKSFRHDILFPVARKTYRFLFLLLTIALLLRVLSPKMF